MASRAVKKLTRLRKYESSFVEAPKLVVASDLGNTINNLLHEEWQGEWESESNVNNKLIRVLSKVNENHTPKGMTRRDRTEYTRLCVGY